MRVGVVARGTHSLHFERIFDTLKRNLSLESRSNINFRFRICFVKDLSTRRTNNPKALLFLLFSFN